MGGEESVCILTWKLHQPSVMNVVCECWLPEDGTGAILPTDLPKDGISNGRIFHEKPSLENYHVVEFHVRS